MREIGRYSYHNKLSVISHPEARLTIGKFCSIAPDVRIFLGDEHRTDWVTTYPFGTVHKDVFGERITGHPATKGDVIIGNDVWIGYGATIMSGVEIGNGAVIAARSHVVKSVAPYELVGGNPAKHIKFRFNDEIINLLLDLKWWDKPESLIRALIPTLTDKPDAEKLKELCKLHLLS
jgi:acetyltransferase-like isoleucine patch superfamily enzyme